MINRRGGGGEGEVMPRVLTGTPTQISHQMSDNTCLHNAHTALELVAVCHFLHHHLQHYHRYSHDNQHQCPDEDCLHETSPAG